MGDARCRECGEDLSSYPYTHLQGCALIREPDDMTGFTVAPKRYSSEGRETIDLIRDQAGAWFLEALTSGCSAADAAFAVHCASCAYKYRSRRGLKDEELHEDAKAQWYTQMFEHLCGRGPDPRSYRSGYEPYIRPGDQEVQVNLLTEEEP